MLGAERALRPVRHEEQRAVVRRLVAGAAVERLGDEATAMRVDVYDRKGGLLDGTVLPL